MGRSDLSHHGRGSEIFYVDLEILTRKNINKIIRSSLKNGIFH